MSAATLRAVELLDADRHDTAGFDSGVPSVDNWLRRIAPVAAAAGTAATWVLCRGHRVVGYYALAMGSIERRAAPSRLGRGQPDPVSALVVDAIDDRAHAFYAHHGFLPLDSRRLYRRVSDIERSLREPQDAERPARLRAASHVCRA